MSDLSDISPTKLTTPPVAPAARTAEEPIDLLKIVDCARHYWRTLAASLVLTMLAGAALFAIVPSRWQAAATVEIGQMPTGSVSITGQTAPTVAMVELPAQAVERMKQRELINVALTSLHIPTSQPDDPQAMLFRNSLKTAVVKGTNFVRVSVAGYSPQEAHDSLSAAVNALTGAHDRMMSPIVERMKLRLADNDKQLADALAERTSLQKMLQGPAKPDFQVEFASHILAVTQLSNKEQQIHRIKLERAALEDLMTPTRTYPTRIIDAVYVNPSPVFPKLSLFLAIAAMLGLGVGLGLALYRGTRSKRP